VKARVDALKAGADSFAKEEFAAVDSDMKGLTEDIENGNIKSAESGSAELQKTYLALELAAIKDKNIGHAKRTVASAIKEGADEDAKRTLVAAQTSVKDAEAYIDGNRHDVAGIEARSIVATANAERLLKITRDTKVAGNKDSETIILEMEAEQKAVAAKAAALAAATGTVAKLKGEKADLASQTETMKADQDFNARVKSIQARFSPEEAEVYRDGDQVLIRLKSLAFPVGHAMLSEANFPLLGKVQQALIDLGSGAVTINGHTDATGSKKTNQKLSIERATAVRAYFVASGKIPAANVTSEGFGDTKPIASNKTAVGRAQNRRVDILVAPNRSSMVF
jgi:outer membrane protein OmpA-like peptidoglycan-associated protein